MSNKITFGKMETTAILMNSMGLPLFLGFARTMTEMAGTAGWILCIYITLVACFFFYIISRLYKPFTGMDPVDLGGYVGGTVGRILVGSILLVHITYISAMVLREFGEYMKLVAFTVSPISFVLLFFLVGMAAGTYKGIEAIARSHAIMVPIIAGGVIIIMISVAPQLNVLNVLPVLGSGPEAIFEKGFFKVSSFSALLNLFILFPFIKSYDDFKFSGYAGLLLTGFFMASITFVYIAAVSYPLSTEMLLPIHYLSRLIGVGRFFQRIESLFMLMWVSSALLYLSVAFFTLVYVFQKTFKLVHHKPLIIQLTIFVYTISLLPANVMEVVEVYVRIFRTYAWLVTFLLTIILLILARFARHKEKRREKACID